MIVVYDGCQITFDKTWKFEVYAYLTKHKKRVRKLVNFLTPNIVCNIVLGQDIAIKRTEQLEILHISKLPWRCSIITILLIIFRQNEFYYRWSPGNQMLSGFLNQ